MLKARDVANAIQRKPKTSTTKNVWYRTKFRLEALLGIAQRQPKKYDKTL